MFGGGGVSVQEVHTQGGYVLEPGITYMKSIQ